MAVFHSINFSCTMSHANLTAATPVRFEHMEAHLPRNAGGPQGFDEAVDLVAHARLVHRRGESRNRLSATALDAGHAHTRHLGARAACVSRDKDAPRSVSAVPDGARMCATALRSIIGIESSDARWVSPSWL